MAPLLNIDISHSNEILQELSLQKTTYFKINPFLDNKALIQKKIYQSDLRVFLQMEQDEKVGVFLLKVNPHNPNSAYIDAIFFYTKNKYCEEYLQKFIESISSIYNINSFFKLRETNDNRLVFFENIGFKKAVVLRDNLFYDGYFHDQSLYYLNL